MKLLLFILSITLLVGCSSSITTNQDDNQEAVSDTLNILKQVDEVASAIIESKAKSYEQPNDEFREKVISSFSNKNDVEVFNKILVKLDKKELSVCSVIEQLFAIDDEALAKAKRQFPDPDQQSSFSNLYSSEIKNGYEKYSKTINLSKKEIQFLNTAYAFHQPVKSFCGKF